MVARKTRKYRGGDRVEDIRQQIRVKEEEIETLRSELKSLEPAVNNTVVKYKKMQKMGVPEAAIRQRMQANGVNASLLYSKSSAVPTSASAAAPMRSGLPFSLGNLGKTLKKTNTAQQKTTASIKPKEKSMQQRLAEEAVSQLKRLKPVGKKQNNKSITSAVVVPSVPVIVKESGKNSDSYGMLPPGWKVYRDEIDTWYESPSGESLWERPVFSNNQGPLPKGWKVASNAEDTWYSHFSGKTQWERPSA